MSDKKQDGTRAGGRKPKWHAKRDARLEVRIPSAYMDKLDKIVSEHREGGNMIFSKSDAVLVALKNYFIYMGDPLDRGEI